MGMGFPREQRVSDLLHEIANLVQSADQYLNESSLSPTPFAKVGKRSYSSKLSPLSFCKVGKKKLPKALFKSLWKPAKTPKPRKSGLQPHKADRLTNRLRKLGEIGATRDVLRARRERKQRDRYHANKALTIKPQKALGTRWRKR